MLKKQKILVIVGPTASGKSALAVELARRFNGEIISADSRQVYRGLDIGTGKITKREMRSVKHHLLDVASPKKAFTAHDFLIRGRKAITTIYRSGRLPIIVGGTGFYIDVLVGRISLPDVPPNKKLRRQLEKKTAKELFKMLERREPARAETIEPHNKRRLIRALEVATPLGRNSTPPKNPYMDFPTGADVLWIGITISKEELERKIRARLATRLKEGMIAEVRRLHKNGLSYKRMEELGLEYRSLARYLQGKLTREEMEKELFRAIKHYAKRQTTYWKRNKAITWLTSVDKKDILAITRQWLSI